MSSLTTECKVCYVAALYDENDSKICEGGEYFEQKTAIEDAKK